jgi:hypothetical protein
MKRLEALSDWALLAVCPDAVRVGTTVYPRGRQTLDLGGDFCRISFWAPDTVTLDLNLFLDLVRHKAGPMPVWASMMLLVREAITTWTNAHKKNRTKVAHWPVHERDDHRCRAPGCGRRCHLHSHHVRFRSHRGGDEPSNLVAVCYSHHRQGIHEGHLRCEGDADIGLRWTLGPRARNGGPFRTYQGDLRLA